MNRLFRSIRSWNQTTRLWPLPPPSVIINRTVHIELAEENEPLLSSRFTAQTLEEAFPKMKLPNKMKRSREQSKQFFLDRIAKYPAGFAKLNIEDYEPIYRDLTSVERNMVIDSIQMITIYYNNVLRKSFCCPSTISVEDMAKMLSKYKNANSRIRFVHFLFVREFDVWRHSRDKSETKRLKAEKEAEDYFENIGCFDEKTGQLQYGYWRNCLFNRYHEKSLQRYSLNRLRQAELFGQKLVIDCSFDEQMADYETTSVARQIASIYAINRYSRDPYHLMFCGYNPANRGYQYLETMNGDIMDKPEYMFNFYREEYQNLLPHNELIYLTPDTKEVMEEYNPNAVYIIGALVSKTYRAALSFEKARAQNIQCVRLPIHRYVQLKPGVKRVLSFQSVFHILLELKQHGDWHRAFHRGIQANKLLPSEYFEELQSIN